MTETQQLIRIVVFAAYFFPHKGGFEQYVLEVYKRMVGSRCEVTIVTSNTENSLHEEYCFGMRVIRLDCWNALGGTYAIPKLNWKNFCRLNDLRKKPFTIVNTHTRFFSFSFLGYLYAKFTKTLLLHTEHGTQHSALRNRALSALSVLYDHTIGAIVVHGANYRIAISHASARFCEHLGVYVDRIVYNGVDVSYFTGGLSKKTTFGLALSDLVVTFVGRLVYGKGVQDILNVWNTVYADTNAQLVIVGDGNFRGQLEKLAQGLHGVYFFGEKNREEILHVLRATDIFVNPSYSEGLPTSVLEAGAVGCAVLATNVGGTKEIIHMPANGLLYAPGDTAALERNLRRLLHDVNMRQRLQQNLHDTVEKNFSWDVIAASYYKYLVSII